MWGIMHFRQYLYKNYFTLQMDHKPLKCLAIVSNVYGKKCKWINTLQDFSFKIVHKARSKHTNVDALSRNLIDVTEKEDEMQDEIQDCKLLQVGKECNETLWTSRWSLKIGKIL